VHKEKKAKVNLLRRDIVLLELHLEATTEQPPLYRKEVGD
jgi:hypothetical protein